MKAKVNILIIVVGILIGAIAYWFQPADQLNEGFYVVSVWSIGAFLGALFLMILLNKKPYLISLFLTLGVEFALLARIIYDDATLDIAYHNLAPFDIIFCALIVFPCAFIGSFLVLLIKKIVKYFQK